MGRMATLSPLGLYNWDDTLFNLMTIPSALDKDTLVQNILAETAELEVLYPNPVILKNLIGVWSAKQIDVWNRLYQSTQYEYNPIENYNRYETGSENGTGSTTHSGTDTSTEAITHGGSDGRTEAVMHGGSDGRTEAVMHGGTDTVTGADTKSHYVAGYDAPTPTAQDDGLFKQTRDTDSAETSTTYGRTENLQETKNYGSTENVQETKNYGETVSKTGGVTHGESIATTNQGGHTLHAHGNIGVTTTQQLIREQREIDLFNLYDIITEDFKMKFCILVY